LASNIDASHVGLEAVVARLATIERLKRKHGATLAGVIARQHELRHELDQVSNRDERLAHLGAEVAEARTQYQAVAATLSGRRHDAARQFATALERLLSELAMDRTRVEVRFNVEPLPEAEWAADGWDRVEFYISPNVGEELRPLSRIVSGGELSRIMLAIKTLTFGVAGLSPATLTLRQAGSMAPGMIFDEVDAGIGGRVADVVGRKLRDLGSAFQVLCITHLPQIAAYADAHFVIEKRIDNGRTRTTVRRLDTEGRVSELARMLGGESVSDPLRAGAREMLAERAGLGMTDAWARTLRGESKSKGESERAKAKRSR
jgi:DNA repair protein RecN (Recombination protein N)